MEAIGLTLSWAVSIQCVYQPLYGLSILSSTTPLFFFPYIKTGTARAGWDMPFYRRGLGGAIQHICWGLWFWAISIVNPVGEVWKHVGLRSTCTFPGQTLLNMQKYKNTQTTPIPYAVWSNVHLQKHFLIFKVFCGCKFQHSFTLCLIIMESERNYCQVGRSFLKPSFNICVYCNVLVRSVEQSVGFDQQEMCQKCHVFMTQNNLSGIRH